MGLPSVSYVSWWAPICAQGRAERHHRQAEPSCRGDNGAMVRSRLAELGFEVVPRVQQTPQALSAMQKSDAEKWLPLIKEFGIKAE